MNTVKPKFKIMLELLRELEAMLYSNPPDIAKVSLIEPVKLEDENKPVLHINPVTAQGNSAIAHSLESYSDFYIKDGLARKIARRTPGVIYYNCQNSRFNSQLLTLIQHINDIKAHIKHAVTTTYPTSNQRFNALKELLPSVVTLNLYRQIRCFENQNVQSIRFTWVNQENVSVPDKVKLLEHLQSFIETAYNYQHLAKLEMMQRVICNTPDELIRLRRTTNVQPVANIVSSVKTAPIVAAMPFIVIQPNMPATRMLKNYDHMQRVQRKTRSDRMENRYVGTLSGQDIEIVCA